MKQISQNTYQTTNGLLEEESKEAQQYKDWRYYFRMIIFLFTFLLFVYGILFMFVFTIRLALTI